MADSIRDSLVSFITDLAGRNASNAAAGKAESAAASAEARGQKETEAVSRESAGMSAATAIREAGAIQQQSDAYMRKIGESLGIVDNTQSEIMVGLATKHRQAALDVVSSTEQVNQLSSVGVLDDPLQFLMNTLQLPEARSAQRNAVSTLSAVGTAFDSTFKQGQGAAQTISMTQAKTSAALTEAKANEQVQLAGAQAAQARAQAAQWKAADVHANMQFDSQQLAAVEAQYRIAQTEDAWKLQQRSAALQAQLTNAQLTKMQEADSADTGAYDEMARIVRETAARNGVPIPVMPEKLSQYKAQAGINKRYAAQVMELYNMGITYMGSGQDQLGHDPATARLVRGALNIQPTTPGGKKTADILDQVWQEIHGTGLKDANGKVELIAGELGVKAAMVVPKGATHEQEMAIYNEAVGRKLGQGGAPLAPIGAVRASFRNVDSWPLMQALKDLDTGPESPMQIGTINDLAKLGMAAYKQGKVKIQDLGNDLGKYAQLALRKHGQDFEWYKNGVAPLNSAVVTLGTKTFDLATDQGKIDFMRAAVMNSRAQPYQMSNKKQVYEADARTLELLEATRKVQGAM